VVWNSPTALVAVVVVLVTLAVLFLVTFVARLRPKVAAEGTTAG